MESANVSVHGKGPPFASPGNTWTEQLKTVYLIIGPIFTWCRVGIGLFGIVGNILTFHIYRKLGFSSSINISYAALALSDFFSVLANMISAFNYLQISVHFSVQTTEQLLRLIGGYPQFLFSRTSALLTAWISLERCLCVLFPTRVKVIITPTLTQLVIVVIFFLGAVPFVFLYLAHRIEWRFDPQRANTTTLALLFHGKDTIQRRLQSFSVFLFGAVYPFLSCAVVAVCTLFLIIRLKQSARWRSQHAPDTNNLVKTDAQDLKNSRPKISTRDIRVTRVVVFVASLFLFCSIPVAAQLLAVFTVQGYSNTGSLRYFYKINGMVATLVSHLNSSLNIVIFTATMQNFRSNLLQILSCG